MDGSDLARRAAARALEMLGPVEATVVTVARVPVSADSFSVTSAYFFRP